MSEPQGHDLYFVETATVQYLATATPKGNLLLVGKPETLDIMDTSVDCSVCGALAPDELADHGLSEYWEQV